MVLSEHNVPQLCETEQRCFTLSKHRVRIISCRKGGRLKKVVVMRRCERERESWTSWFWKVEAQALGTTRKLLVQIENGETTEGSH
jgi:hypothetical protein